MAKATKGSTRTTAKVVKKSAKKAKKASPKKTKSAQQTKVAKKAKVAKQVKAPKEVTQVTTAKKVSGKALTRAARSVARAAGDRWRHLDEEAKRVYHNAVSEVVKRLKESEK